MSDECSRASGGGAHHTGRIAGTLAAILLIAMVSGPLAHWWARRAQAGQAYGIPTRIPWTTSRIHGTPEPPPPYELRRAFPNLTFSNPLDVTVIPGTNRIAVAEQFGKVYSFPNDENCRKADLLIDIFAQVRGNWENIPFCKGPSNVYGVTFHPQFQKNHYVYICYVMDFHPPDGRPPLTPKDQEGSRVSRFTVSDTDPPRIDPKSEQIVITWYSGGHNGGCVKFGNDGYLYISTGDGADPDPPDKFNTGQDIGDLLSSVLRIDVDHPSGDKPYSIPKDNPFVNMPGARPEVWCYGLRNPWRMNFDRKTGNLWIGDVGWELWESVCCGKPGGNYGWSIMEGPNPVHPDGNRGPTPIIPPLVALSHAEAASLSGGLVYRGKKLPELYGHYIFGDWQTRLLWAAKCVGPQEDQLEPHRTISETDQKIVAFGDDQNGEPIIVDHGGGGLWRIARNQASSDTSHFPRKLSETGLFTSTKDQVPVPGVIPFSINAPQWLDGAIAQRWVAVPGTGNVVWGKGVWGDDKPVWPNESVLARTLSIETRPGDPLSSRRVETQVLHFDGKQWRPYSYAWNDQQNDADLVDGAGDDKTLSIYDPSLPDKSRKQQWHFASRAQCMTCHTVWTDYTLAFNAPQLDREENFGGVTDNEVRTFRHLGLLYEPLPSKPDDAPASEKPALTNPYDARASLYERARSYLHVNCSGCHRFGGGGSALFDVRKELPLDKMNLVDARPNLGNFGIDDARIVCPADPARSVLMYRISKLGRGRMPHIGSDLVDDRGIELIRQWILSLPGSAGATTAGNKSTYDADLRTLESAKASSDASAAADRLLASAGGALALLCELQAGKLPPQVARIAAAKGYSSTQDTVRDLFRRFNPAEQQIARLGSNINAKKLLAMPGDIERGRKIFFESGGTGLCSRCHIVSGRGTDLGPDLTHIASKYKRADLLDNILFPSKSIAPGYATYVIRTTSGDTYVGFLLGKTDKEVVIKDAQLKQTHIPAADIHKMVAQPISAMPDGLLSDLEAQQAADVLEFVASLK